MPSGVHVLVVGYRRADLLARCLTSVARHLPDAAVHVWDNTGLDSTAPTGAGDTYEGLTSLDDVVAAWPMVRWHRSPTNVGFAAAVNALAAEALAGSAVEVPGAVDGVTEQQLLVLLNPDAELQGSLPLTLAAARCRGVAAAAPRVDDDRPGREPWDVAHRRAGLTRALVAYAGYAPQLRATPASDLYSVAPSDVDGYLSGACLVIAASAWRAVSEFDEEFFLYGEEADWQRRARHQGWQLRWVDEPGVRHRGHGTVVGDADEARRSQDLLAANIALDLERGFGVHRADAYLAGTAVLDRVQRNRRRARAVSTTRRAPQPSVVITVNRLVRGGAERHHVVLARELHRRGHEVVIVCMQRFGPLIAEVPAQVRVIRQPWWCPAIDLPDGPAVVISGDTNTETGWATGWRRGRRDRRWLVGAHVPPDPGGPTYGRLLAGAMARADGFVALSQVHREQLAAHHPLPRLGFVAPNGVVVSAAAVPTSRLDRPGPVRLVMLSRILEHKNPHLLVEALAGLLDLDWQLVIHGDGPDRDRLQALTPASVVERVQWRGWSPGPDAALAEADLLCVPSGSEAFPMVILEAMARGVPVIASAVCAVPEMLDDGRAGLLVDQIDVEGWREGLRAALTDRAAWPRLARAGLERVHERYTVEAMADAYEAAIDGVLSQAPSAGNGVA